GLRPGIRLRDVEWRRLLETWILGAAGGRRGSIELRHIERMAGVGRIEARGNIEAWDAGRLHVGLWLVAVIAADEVMHRLAAAEREQRGSADSQHPRALPLANAVVRISGCQSQPLIYWLKDACGAFSGQPIHSFPARRQRDGLCRLIHSLSHY